MAAYRRVYDSRHLQADCKEPESAPGPRQSSTGCLFILFVTGYIRGQLHSCRCTKCHEGPSVCIAIVTHVTGYIHRSTHSARVRQARLRIRRSGGLEQSA